MYTILYMEILHLGNPILRQKALPVEHVTDEIRELVKDMFDTMDESRGVGLAAPQVGRLLRLFVVAADDGIRRVFINPHITSTSEDVCNYEEGCLSIPDVWHTVSRPASCTVQALDESGRPFVLEAQGFLARVIQHEYDHLEGILYIDRTDEDFRSKTIAHFEKRAERKKRKEEEKKAKAARIAAKKAAKAVTPC